MEKFFLKSHTVISILLGAVVNLAPELNWSFSAEDGQFISETIDAAMNVVLTAYGLWGRARAEAKLRFF
jgi:hypothetical protein